MWRRSVVEDMDEIVEEFLVESHENLDQLDRDLVALEQDPGSRELLVEHLPDDPHHQGHQRLPGLHRLESVTHVGENLLSPAARRRPDADARHDQRAAGDGRRGPRPARRHRGRPAARATSTVDVVTDLLGRRARGAAGRAPSGRRGPDERPSRERARRRSRRGQPRTTPVARAGPPQEVAAHEPQARRDPRRTPARPRRTAVAAGPVTTRPARGAAIVADSTIRVDVDLLDALMHLVGELVLTRNQIVQSRRRPATRTWSATSQRLNLITSELQEGVMKTRMQPIDHVWTKLPRVVRDLGAAAAASRSALRDGGPRDRARQDHPRGRQGPADPPGAQRRRPRHRDPRRPAWPPASRPRACSRCAPTTRAARSSSRSADDGAGIDADARSRARRSSAGLITADAARPDEPTRDVLQPDLPARLLDRGDGHQRLRPRRRHGRRQDQHRGASAAPSTSSRALGQGTDLPAQDPADAGDHPGADRRRAAATATPIPQVSLLELVAPRRRAGRDRGRGRPRRARLPAARQPAAAGPPRPSASALDVGERRATATSYIVVLQADDRRFGLVVDRRPRHRGDRRQAARAACSRPSALYAGATIMGDGRSP